MKRFHITLVLCLAFPLIFGSVGMAQDGERRAGTNAASELLIPVGSRYVAMGGANISQVNGIEAIYWNPAGLARAERSAYGMFTHMRHIADINLNYLAVSASFGSFGTLGFSVKALDIGDINVTTETSPDGTGALVSPTFIIAGLTYSRALTDRVSVGLNAKLVSERIDRVSGTGASFDFGVQYNDLLSINGLSLGVALKNVGPSIRYGGTGLITNGQLNGVDRGSTPVRIEAGRDELPSSLDIGVGYSMDFGESSKLNLVSTYSDQNFDDDLTRVGAEYSFNDVVFLRGGYSFAFGAGEDPAGESRFIYGMTMGAGFHQEVGGVDLSLDYAYRQVDFFQDNNVFTVKLGF